MQKIECTLLSTLLCRFTLAAVVIVVLPHIGFVHAADIYVSTDGDDVAPGTYEAPVATLARVRDICRRFSGKEAVTVQVADGVYYLPDTLVFSSADSGMAEHPVIYRAENEGGAVLSGGSRLELDWLPYRDGIFQARTPDGMKIDQLFVDGVRQRMARYPNYDADQPTAAYQGFAADAFSKERASRWENPVGAYIHAMHRSRWGGYHYRITGKDDKGEVTYEGGWQNNRQMGMHKELRMVENVFEELDAAGEWFHDTAERSLYFKPAAAAGENVGATLRRATIEVVRLPHLIEFNGSRTEPVRFITLQGFAMQHAARTFMETKEPLLRSDWTIYRGGALKLTGTEHINLCDLEFDQVGGNSVFVNEYNRDVLVSGCHIHDSGASGICFVGDSNAVRDPLFEYRQKNDLSKIDRTPGPKTDNYPADCVVEDCLIHGIGRVERQPAGVLIEMAADITVRDCSIYDCACAGINIGDGCWGGHLIERCDVFDTVLETHDHGSFNSWGRDRYWRSDHLTASQSAVDDDPTLPFLDAIKTTVIRNSRWRCDHGWDIDLDDGSSNYDIYNNLLLAGGLKLREGFRRHAWNNITINNGFHPHVWFNHSQDEVFGNIFMAPHRGARMPSEIAKGKRVGGNLFYSHDPTIKDQFAEFGWDVDSIVADPKFVDPSHGDYRVQEGSPAFDIGFENFPMDQFGVKKPSLKSIARTPEIPALDVPGPSESPIKVATSPMAEFWLGAKLSALKGEEFSAFGVSKEDGGVALAEVPKRSAAASCGLVAGDLIQSLNATKIRDVNELLTAYARAGDASLIVRLVRNQQAIELTVDQAFFLEVESASSADRFSKLIPQSIKSVQVAANQKINDDPIGTLVDGQLADGYGPVFGNGVETGAYRIDLGTIKHVSRITSWSANKNGNRGAQKLTVYGSRSPSDPGWNVEDETRFTPLATIDTTGFDPMPFSAASLRARNGNSLGSYRWIVWRVAPVTPKGENTAFQELHAE